MASDAARSLRDRAPPAGAAAPASGRWGCLLAWPLLCAALAAATAAPAQQPPDVPALLDRYGCSLCHAEREQVVGPSWAEIGAKYRQQSRAAAAVADVIRKGRHGGGPWPMPPLPEVTEADAKRIVGYILEPRP